MSAVCVFVPVVVASWPVVSAAAVAAMSALGYAQAKAAMKSKAALKGAQLDSVDMQLENSEALTDDLGAGDELAFQKGDVAVTFYKDPHGKCGIKVCGKKKNKQELEAIGKEVGQKVIQRYIYDRLRTELQDKQFIVLDEGVTEDSAIRIRVRRWQE